VSEFGPCQIIGCEADSLVKLNEVPVCFPHFEETLNGIHVQTVALAQEHLL
jgi:hypothetical protein